MASKRFVRTGSRLLVGALLALATGLLGAATVAAADAPFCPPGQTPTFYVLAALQDRWDKDRDSIWKPEAFIVILATVIVWFLSVRVGQEGHRGAPQ